jgi:hypothetical protein
VYNLLFFLLKKDKMKDVTSSTIWDWGINCADIGITVLKLHTLYGIIWYHTRHIRMYQAEDLMILLLNVVL